MNKIIPEDKRFSRKTSESPTKRLLLLFLASFSKERLGKQRCPGLTHLLSLEINQTVTYSRQFCAQL